MSIPRNAIQLNLLLVSMDYEDEEVMRGSLLEAGFTVNIKRVTSREEIHNALDHFNWNLVLIDSMMGTITPIEIIELLRKRIVEVPYLVMYGSLTDVSAIAILQKSGHHQYITKGTISTLASAMMSEMALAGDRMSKQLEAEAVGDMLMDAFGTALEMRDHDTQGHTQRVKDLALKLARRLKMPKSMIIDIYRGSLLHDIGKIGVPDSILLKDGLLDDDERKIIQKHPGYAYDLLKPITMLGKAVLIPFCHHEKWDGTGYPRGLKGLDIPIEARIFAFADNYDALTSDRPYRSAWSKTRTLDHIKAEAGAIFDPEITPIFLNMMEE